MKREFAGKELPLLVALIVLALPLARTQGVSVTPNSSHAELELIWVFDLYEAVSARVNATVTIHPPAQKWSSTSLSFGGYRVANFTAIDHGTGKPLPVDVSQQTDLGTTATVRFTSPQGDGYQFSLLFDSIEGFGKLGNDYILTWSWGASFPEPQHVTVIFPMGFDCAHPLQLGCVSLEGSPANYTRTKEEGRIAVSFLGTSPANASLTWLVAYQQPTISTIATSTSISAASTSTAQPSSSGSETTTPTSPSPGLSLFTILAALVVFAGLFWVVLSRIRKRSR